MRIPDRPSLIKYSWFHLLIVFLAFGQPACSSADIRNQPLKGRAAIELQGHRGARGLRPENTLPAFTMAIKNNMTTLELDTHLTRDGQLILYHDNFLNPLMCAWDGEKSGQTVRPRAIQEMTVAELKELDCGLRNPKWPRQKAVEDTRLSTLPEFFDFVKRYEESPDGQGKKPLLFNIEIKFQAGTDTPEFQEKAAAAMVAAIEAAGVDERTTVQSFQPAVLPRVKKRNAKIRTSALFAPTYWEGLHMLVGLGDRFRRKIIQDTLAVGAEVVSPYKLYVTPEFIREAHEKKLLVIVWTVNDSEEMERLIQMGVDGIISDYPNRLKKVWRKFHK